MHSHERRCQDGAFLFGRPRRHPNRFAARDRKSKPGARVEGRKTRAERLAKQKTPEAAAAIRVKPSKGHIQSLRVGLPEACRSGASDHL